LRQAHCSIPERQGFDAGDRSAASRSEAVYTAGVGGAATKFID
jgi:hypothetical protein